MLPIRSLLRTAALFCLLATSAFASLQLNDLDYFTSPGFDALVYSNKYNGNFDDSKMAGVEFIHHGIRTVTNGDVRLRPTPDQWDEIGQFIERKVDRETGTIIAYLSYPEYDFDYRIVGRTKGDQLLLSVELDRPLPEELIGRAGFNLEFIPSAYIGSSYLMDGSHGQFPLYPSGPTHINPTGETDPLPLAKGSTVVMAPESSERCIRIESDQELALYDGRNKAQNGWFVLRSLLPADSTGTVLRWTVTAKRQPQWTRDPVILHSQVGYHPAQDKVALIELDKNAEVLQEVSLLRLDELGDTQTVLKQAPTDRGMYLRYHYVEFDFSSITQAGLYRIAYGESLSDPIIIGEDVYNTAWQPTLDVFFPVQMDHMLVNEAYRVWHGAAHLDDALQAPPNVQHFDLYAMGPTTDTDYKAGEHIPGLDIGGWFDAGDFDLRTQTHYQTVLDLVKCRETFGINRDQTTIDYDARHVEMHTPDGKPDILQQIEHGTLALIAQFRAVGHAIPGIIVGDISQYHHLGDAQTITDGLIYNPELGPNENNGFESGRFDDRWAFTTHTTALNYGSTAALAAASRVLQGYNDELAEECLQTALKTWDFEQSNEPALFRHGNTTGGRLEVERFNAALQLLITTGQERFREAIHAEEASMKENFLFLQGEALAAVEYMDEDFRELVKSLVAERQNDPRFVIDNPFDVIITRGGWAGNGLILRIAINQYLIHKTFPELADPESVFKGLNYLYGLHPDSSISFVSGVGFKSKQVAYGSNRADFSFIAGGIVPGILVLPPDFPENREDWPFLWGENEYVISMGAPYIFLVHAVQDLLKH